MKVLILFYITALANLSPSVCGKLFHGNSYNLRNVLYNTYVSSTAHSYKPGSGLISGKVFGQVNFKRLPTQIWDVAVLGKNSENIPKIWLLPKQGYLNELTIVAHPGSETPDKNIVNLIEVPGEKNVFLIKSLPLNKCFFSGGEEVAIYTTCDPKQSAQWFEFELVDDDAIQLKGECTSGAKV